ncbi:hypothetical protein O181_069840 [Austropuccinia psidii MF-1]|uniref:Glutamate-rich WD repeat-containing protein 1 n=1 Tax=Austropuccinia psidii MF-1 TaxID=1389203 RepID=A0A9Q3I8G7_9BASI|nr:hypothetical protein [Austropuccinia psidii MF-1]
MKNRKRSISPQSTAKSNDLNKSKLSAIDQDDLPARLDASIKVGEGEEGIGEFEDAWEDEFEEEDGGEDNNSLHFNNDDDIDDDDDDENEEMIPGDGKSLDNGDDQVRGDQSRSPSPTAYLPHLHGSKLAQDEELVVDPTAYKMLHNLSMAWPALSFDVLRDDLGEERSRMPHTACIVAGTQAEASGDVDQDEIMIMKWEGLSRMTKDPDLEEDEDEEDEESDDEVDEEPSLTFKTIPHKGSVNRIKAQPLPLPLSNRAPQPPESYFAASFSGTGKVHIFDIAPYLFALQCPSSAFDQVLPKKPLHSIHQHGRAEGFALAWGPSTDQASSLRLLSGDVHSKIFLTVSNKSGFTTNTMPYSSHTSSVEDLQWSPSEPTVFASCSADRSLKIWDVRVKDRRNVMGVDGAHPTDVNVLSWNQKTSYLIVTGGDEGGIKVWDLRNLPSKSPQPPNGQKHQAVASFNWHKAPITSIEWHPTEDSCFVASGADDQVTLWDLSVEADEEEAGTQASKLDVPAQLLFSHQGQSQIKEVHWHPQIPGMVISTALDGLNVFKTISI